MKTKLMRFITSFFESWREEKKVLALWSTRILPLRVPQTILLRNV